MQIPTYYKEVYQNIGQTINVPKVLQNQKVEVHFLPITQSQEKISATSKNYGTGDKLVSYFADVPLPEHENDDFVLPERQPLIPMDSL